MALTTLQLRGVLVCGAAAAAFATDFLTKWLIVTFVMVPPRTIEIVPFFNLTLGFNTGVSFGIFRDLFAAKPMWLAAIAGVIAAGLLAWALRTTKRIETIALGLIIGGAVGNLVDRVRHGAVTDFLDFHVGEWHWPAFNMADVMIFIGVTLLITGSFWPARSAASLPVQPSRPSDTTARRDGGQAGDHPVSEAMMPLEKPRRRRT